MTKTVIEKMASSSEAAVFKVGGTLGYHENKTLQKFFDECKKRSIGKIVLDFSDLKSLGGGCARIIRAAAEEEGCIIAIVRASPTVSKFLNQAGDESRLLFASSVEEAVGGMKFSPDPGEFASGGEADEVERREDEKPRKDEEALVAEDEVDEILSGPLHVEPSAKKADVPDEPAAKKANVSGRPPDASAEIAGIVSDPPRVIILGHDGGGFEAPGRSGPSEAAVKPSSSGERAKTATKDPAGPDHTPQRVPKPADTDKAAELRNLKKKVVHYNTLLTISGDFNRLESRESLIDAFLLTIIAQIGVESAAFYEAKKDLFACAASKGVDTGHGTLPAIAGDRVDIEEWRRQSGGRDIDTLPLAQDVKAALKEHGFAYGALFIIQDEIRGVVFLGTSIRDRLESDWTDFLRVLMNQAAVSYEKTRRLEEESERTLGLVHTLISLIEENTVVKGTTDLVANYTYAIAVKLDYAKEHMKDLMFGTVLRDIGMIKVSDLILRSPRELAHEEWEIIKRHPNDGASMLEKMKFSRHTQDIVAHHHERFNGEGYPAGLKGHGIPLGARIVSVVESYAVMLRDRPSRPALTQEEALHTLKENWGLRYDPDVVQALTDIIEEEIRTGKKMAYDHREIFNL
jgi:anti-anti-sigma regulatory factor